MLSFAVRIWTWKQWDTHAFQWTHSFSCYKHPSTTQGKLVYPFLPHCCVFSPSPCLSLPDQHNLWTPPVLTVLSGHLASPVLSSNDQLTVPFLPSGASVLWTIVLWGHTALPSTALQDTHQQLWEASHPGTFTRKAWKDFLEHQFRGPTTSQTIRDYSKARIHFPLLLPHRYPWEKTNLQKNSPCQLTSPARCMMTLNPCLWVLTLIVNAQEFWKAIWKISPSPPHTPQPPGLGYAFFPFYSFSHVCWNWHFLFSVHSLLGINAGSSGEACTIFPVFALGEPRGDGLNVPGSNLRITI